MGIKSLNTNVHFALILLTINALKANVPIWFDTFKCIQEVCKEHMPQFSINCFTLFATSMH